MMYRVNLFILAMVCFSFTAKGDTAFKVSYQSNFIVVDLEGKAVKYSSEGQVFDEDGRLTHLGNLLIYHDHNGKISRINSINFLYNKKGLLVNIDNAVVNPVLGTVKGKLPGEVKLFDFNTKEKVIHVVPQNLIRDLGHEKYKVRKKAYDTLRIMSPEIIPYLKKRRAEAKDPEINLNLNKLIEELSQKVYLEKRLLTENLAPKKKYYNEKGAETVVCYKVLGEHLLIQANKVRMICSIKNQKAAEGEFVAYTVPVKKPSGENYKIIAGAGFCKCTVYAVNFTIKDKIIEIGGREYSLNKNVFIFISNDGNSVSVLKEQ